MPIIKIQILVNAPIQVCFDLSRSIELHTISTQHTGEEAIAGTTSGLINLNETVTWRATHFGIWQILTSKITEFNQPHFFVDEMVLGAFKSFRHEHHFKEMPGNSTLLTDIFNYKSPLGIFGKLADVLFLKKYMYNLLVKRNEVIKEYAETGKYKSLIRP